MRHPRFFLLSVPHAVPATCLLMPCHRGRGRGHVRHRGQACGLWLWAALLAGLLMAIAPVVSWTLQAVHAAHAATAAHPAEAEANAPADSAHHGAHHGHRVADAAPLPPALPDNPHADHGAACDYCLIAARALAVVAALLLALLLRLPPTHAPPPRRIALPATAWPAHPARGPPLIA